MQVHTVESLWELWQSWSVIYYSIWVHVQSAVSLNISYRAHQMWFIQTMNNKFHEVCMSPTYTNETSVIQYFKCSDMLTIRRSETWFTRWKWNFIYVQFIDSSPLMHERMEPTVGYVWYPLHTIWYRWWTVKKMYTGQIGFCLAIWTPPSHSSTSCCIKCIVLYTIVSSSPASDGKLGEGLGTRLQ